MKYILLVTVFLLISCQDTNSNSLDELAFGQPELDLSGGSGGGSGGTPPTPFQLAMSVVSPKCTGCHTGYHSSWGNYNTEQDWIDAVSGGNDLVNPGDADASGLVDRLKVWGTGGPGADNMPQDPAAALTATEYGYISDWINGL